MTGTDLLVIDGPLAGQKRTVYGYTNDGAKVHFHVEPSYPLPDGIFRQASVHKYEIKSGRLVYGGDDLSPTRCSNPVCSAVLSQDDFPVFGGTPMHFGEHHLCQTCFSRFDGQKMRGRFRMIGLQHDQLVTAVAGLDQLGVRSFHVGHPSEEGRYTESQSEWIEWQKTKAEKR